MKSYTTQFLRNVGIVGHGDTGKTQLVSSLLYTAGMTQRLGKVADGNTVTDWDEEEIARKITMQTGLGSAEAALVVVDAVAGVQVVTEKVWDYCTEYSLPRAMAINWMDRELASFERALE